jgi:hypothetical protein
MKIYAVGKDNNCIELNFASEDAADLEFNQIVKSKNGIGEIKDMTGKKKEINVFYGYSTHKGDICCLLEKK